MKKAILKIINFLPKGKLLTGTYFLQKNYLKKEGWTKSMIKKMPIDKNGNEIPWFTYSAIHFLTPRLTKDLSVFEYGSGNSTIWFSKYCKTIVSTEHNENWYNMMKPKFDNFLNINYILKDTQNADYQKEILNYSNEFEIIIIDGRERVDCAKNSLLALKENGVVIWDNSDRDEYKEGYDFLLNNGFKRLDFWSLGPINPYAWCTSFFYKTNNCLNL